METTHMPFAFPAPSTSDGFPTNTDPGMSLRDYFAAKALVICEGIVDDLPISRLKASLNMPDDSQWDFDAHYVPALAAYAYRIADAMMVERSRSQS